MKYDTIDTINLLKSLIEEKRAHLRGIENDLNAIQYRLHACTTSAQVDAIHRDFKETVAMAEEELAFIKKAKARIAKFYAPAA